MKLIIDIPEELLKETKTEEFINIESIDTAIECIKNGTPLDDVKAEIKAMFPPSGNWMYDEECEHEHTVCEVLSDVLQILDNVSSGKIKKQRKEVRLNDITNQG